MDLFTMIFGVVMLGAFVGLIISAKKQNTNQNAKGIAIILAIVVIVCGLSIGLHQIFRDKNSRFFKIENSYTASIGHSVGEYLAKTSPKSKVLVIVSPRYKSDKNQQVLINSLKQGLGDSMMKVEVKPLKIKLPSGASLMKKMRAKDFNVLEKIYKPTIIVTLVGLPHDIADLKIWEEALEDPKRAPKLVVVNGSVSHLYKAIKAGTIIAAVRYNPTVIVDENDVCPSDLGKAFAKRYLLITPKNVDKIDKTFKNKIFMKK